jgi:hypothetical protein
MIQTVCVIVGLCWILSVWGAVPHDKNGRTDR